MTQRATAKALNSAVLACSLLLAMAVVEVQAKPPKEPAPQQQTLSAQEAAAKAKALHGGKVLKVSRKGSAYRVRLLKESGRIVTVTIEE